MRIVAAFVVAVLAANAVALPAAAEASVEELFNESGLFGIWATDCKLPATPGNPHVNIVMPSPGIVFEEHDLGSDFAVNRYSVLSAKRVSANRLAVEVIFQPGGDNEERQKLEFQIGKATRRTMFNQTEGGDVRVKNGVALAHGIKTPLLKKCE